jgi:hypothetical protein
LNEGIDVSHAALARKAPVVSTSRASTVNPASAGLRIGDADDTYEQEAERVADEIVRGEHSKHQWSLSDVSVNPAVRRKCSCGGSGDGGSGCAECKKEEEEQILQRHPAGPAPLGMAPPIVHHVLNSPGRPLDGDTRGFFELRFGHDLSAVRIHTDARAAQSARQVNAAAYSVGSDVVFDHGMFAPQTLAGRRLIAHELAHVLQQRGNRGPLGRATLQRQPKQPTGTALDADDQKIVDTAQREASKFKCNVGPVIWGILHKHFPADGRKLAGTGCEAALPGLRTEFSTKDPKDPKLTRSVPMLYAGKAFIASTDAAHLQDRIADVAKEIETIDAWRLSNFLIDAQDLSNPKITGPLRSMSNNDLVDYKNKTKDSDVKRYVENLATFSTPTQPGAGIDPSGNMTMKIGNVDVVIKPDVLGVTGLKGGDTSWSFKVDPRRIPGYDIDKGKVKNYPGYTPVVTFEIVTSYEKGVPREGPSGYGRGTTAEDIRNKATSIRFHEGSHGEDFINFVRQHPYPVFTGANDMKVKDFEDAKKAYNSAEADWKKGLAKAKRQGECVGTTIDQFHKGEKGYTNICP